VVGDEMRHNNLNKKNNRYVITAATLFTLAIMTATASIMASAPAAATTTTDTATTATTATTSPTEEAGMIELSPEPVYQERQATVSETPINQTHVQLTTSGEGTITLPNTTETISITSTGSLLTSLDGTAAGNIVITTTEGGGSESATAKFFGIARFGMEEGRGIIIALLDTDSTTGRLAPLDGMILAGQIEIPLEEETALVTLWEWQSGIPLPTGTTTPPPPEELPPLMDDTTTTTTTNATTTDADTDAATTTAAAPEEEVGAEGEEQQQQQQQTTPTIPPAPNPLFE
jgi:hypothetical protein